MFSGSDYKLYIIYEKILNIDYNKSYSKSQYVHNIITVYIFDIIIDYY